MSTDPRPRLLWAISHPTLVRAELPVLRRAGFDVVAEEPEPSVLRELDVVNYPDTRTDDGDGVSELGARLRLWARNGEVSRDEAAAINATFDAVMVATRLDVAINVRRWFAGSVFFRYFGNVPAIPGAARVPEDRALLAGVTGVPIFRTLLDAEVSRALDHHHVLRTVVPAPPVPEGVRVGDDEHVCLYLGGYPNAVGLRSWVWSVAHSLPETPVMVLGLTEADRQAFTDLADNVHLLPRLADDEYWRLFASSSVLVYPHQDRRHSHYVPLEAMALGVPCLVVANSMVAAEATPSVGPLGPASGVFSDADAIAMALPGLVASEERRREIAEAQRPLLAPFTKPAVLEQAQHLAASVSCATTTGAGARTSPTTVPHGIPTAAALRSAWADGLQHPLTLAPTSVAASDALARGWSARVRRDPSGALSHLMLRPGPDVLIKLGGPVAGSSDALTIEVSVTSLGEGRPNATVELVRGDDVTSAHAMLMRSNHDGTVTLGTRPLRVEPGQAVRVRVRAALEALPHTLTAVGLRLASMPLNGSERPDRLWQTARADVAALPGAALPVRTLRARVGAGIQIGSRRYRHWATAHAVVFARPAGGGRKYVESVVVLGHLVRLRRSAAVDRDVVAAGTIHGVERLTLEEGCAVKLR